MSLLKTFLQDLRVAHPSDLDRDELRRTQDGMLTAVINMTNSANSIVSPGLRAEAMKSIGRELDVPVYKKGSVTISNTRSCTIGGGQSDSDLVRIVWKTVAADILMVPSQYGKNHISKLFDFNRKVIEIVDAFKVEIEQDLETAFDANKSQVYNSSIVGGEFGFVGDAIQVLPTQLQFFFNYIDAINLADDFTNPNVKVIANHVVMPTVSQYINQGGGNAVNSNFQFAGKDFTFSNRVNNGAGINATGYFMPDGSIGLLTRVDADAEANHIAGDGTQWRKDTLPGLPFPVGIQYKSKCDDQSALEVSGLTHLKATMVEHYQISFDYAIVVPFNSDIATNPSSIRKFEFIPAP